MPRSPRVAVLALLLIAAGCGGFENPVGLTRQGRQVEVISTCEDRGITRFTVIDSSTPEFEPGQTTTTADPDAEPVVLYEIIAPEVDEGEELFGVAEFPLDRPPLGWTVAGSVDAFDLDMLITIEVEYGDAQGATDRLRLEQIPAGSVWIDEEVKTPAEFAELIRTCDPDVELPGRTKTVLTLLAIVSVLAVVGAALTFGWSLVRRE